MVLSWQLIVKKLDPKTTYCFGSVTYQLNFHNNFMKHVFRIENGMKTLTEHMCVCVTFYCLKEAADR